jgi:hypothetical protein
VSARRAWIVGAGRRVRETALPALDSLAGEIELAGILARTARRLELGGHSREVRALASLAPGELCAGDLLYVAVGKDAVPEVLGELARHERGGLELLIDTPVLRMKHARHLGLLSGWSAASVAEDAAFLPWHDTARAAAGEAQRVTFEHAAYAYHGVAQARALLGSSLAGACVLHARRVREQGVVRRELAFEGGRAAIAVEPRDYAAGRVVLEGAHARVSDRLAPGEHGLALEVLLADGACIGFRAGDARAELAPPERELTRGDSPGASATARMAAMKRVAFRRLLQRVARGEGAYPLALGLEDMVVDWFLERFGRWKRGRFSDLSHPLARCVWGTLGRLS